MARGRRFDMTDWLARYLLGPASVAHPRRAGRSATEEERRRDSALRDEFVRVRDASGRVYLVDRATAEATGATPVDDAGRG
ncbi:MULTISPECIES: hypothetical protein [Cellulomonas]|uniref:hypothetical protein n=1 Tax=Cellulomonas TaxID=1707 RepID=UPI0010A7ECA9|nr:MULTISPECIES: hypothetical protein [Cellulomonas]